MPQINAVNLAMNILTGNSHLDEYTFKPIGGLFTVDRVTQSITVEIGKNRSVFDFSD